MLLELPTVVWVANVQRALTTSDLAAVCGVSRKSGELVEAAAAKRLEEHQVGGGRLTLGAGGLSAVAACFLVERHTHVRRVCTRISASRGATAVVSEGGGVYLCGWSDTYGQLCRNLEHVRLVEGRYGSRRLDLDYESQYTLSAAKTGRVRTLPSVLGAQVHELADDDTTIENVVCASVGFHTVIVLADGTLLAAGNNREGQLGCYEPKGTAASDVDPAELGVHHTAVLRPIGVGGPGVAAVSWAARTHSSCSTTAASCLAAATVMVSLGDQICPPELSLTLAHLALYRYQRWRCRLSRRRHPAKCYLRMAELWLGAPIQMPV